MEPRRALHRFAGVAEEEVVGTGVPRAAVHGHGDGCATGRSHRHGEPGSRGAGDDGSGPGRGR
ncbi:hypothetical protein CUT44_03860 [Streptomyces carminius]|uniref:Uncharacterized protein n=1 Tax=Streptomyces carminius TaxID=2665496 RepID=A0A2M8M624_9ACTN|nr:hypothetical protein CUT44_03860 [Streptomyces carminius]